MWKERERVWIFRDLHHHRRQCVTFSSSPYCMLLAILRNPNPMVLERERERERDWIAVLMIEWSQVLEREREREKKYNRNGKREYQTSGFFCCYAIWVCSILLIYQNTPSLCDHATWNKNGDLSRWILSLLPKKPYLCLLI